MADSNNNRVSIFQETDVEVAFLKAGLMGFGGSGKSMTAALLAEAIAKVRGIDRVAYFDTETGSDYLKPFFKARGIRLLAVKSRAFSDLLTAMREAEAQGFPLIIDSVTHVWAELQRSFKKRKKIQGKLQFHHWGPIKEEWQELTDLYTNSGADLIMCGRAGWEYDMEEDSEGNKELLKTGVKMKAETEMGYEPSLLLLMERVDRAALQRDSKARGWVHRCVVLKDRFDLINNSVFDFEKSETGAYLVNNQPAPAESINHVFHALRPHFDSLNIGGEHKGIDTSRTSEDRFEANDRSWYARREQIEINCEKITAALQLAGVGSQSTADKQKMRQLFKEHFGTESWKEIETRRSIDELEAGLRTMRIALGLDPAPTDPMTDEEVDALNELIAKASEAGLVAKSSAGLAFQALLSEDWTELRRLREIIVEKMQAEAETSAAEKATETKVEEAAPVEAAEANGAKKKKGTVRKIEDLEPTAA